MISVVTPVFNGVKHIEGCIENVAEQRASDYEHIIVDGASTDGTVDKIIALARRYPNLRWVSEKDRGQADAMNRGTALARGSIIGVLNCDDFYEPGTLAYIARQFESYPSPSLCVGNCNVLRDDGSLDYVNRPRRLDFCALLLGNEEFSPFPVNPAAYFYHKALHDAIGGYNLAEHYVLDLDFLLRAVRAGHVFYLDRLFGNYRLVPGTKTYDDIQAGTAAGRFERFLERFRAELAPREKTRFALLRGWCYVQSQLTRLRRGLRRRMAL